MYNIGVVPGKFFPPHRGHLNQIIQAATKCKKVFIVVSDNENITLEKCEKVKIPFISLNERALWMSKELQGIENIEVLILNENNILPYPDGSEQWCKKLVEVVPDKIDIIFGGEKEYQHTFMKHLPGVKYKVYDYKRSRYPISGTEIRENYLKNWDYILGCARPFFAKKILITGTESCGKSTLVKYLAKIFHTSWSEEYGRYYSRDFLGGNESLFKLNDFKRIAQIQFEQDEDALKNANKICFFDSDAILTKYYSEMYLGNSSLFLNNYIDSMSYDVVLLMGPEVEWIPDGQRFLGDYNTRKELHEKLKQMYYYYGFKDRIIEINSPDYNERLNNAIQIADNLLNDKNFMNRH